MKEKQDKNYSIRDMKMEELIPSNIDGVFISLNEDGKRQVDLMDSMNGERYTKWKAGRGGVFQKDLFLWIQNKEHGKYVFMESGKEKLIIRLIDDEELEDFESRKLIQGKIKDKSYMTFRNLCEIEESKGKNGYIDEIIPEELFNADEIKPIAINIPHEEDEANSIKSVSLF